MSGTSRLTARIAVALLGATAVVAAELAALALSVRLSVAAFDGAVPATVPSLPVVTVSVVAIGGAVVVRQQVPEGARTTLSGVALIVAAPVTAFGGGCGITGGGLVMFRSGVRIGIGVGQCVTFFNGALLVLGYALLAAGLWLATERLAVRGVAGLQAPKLSD